MNLQTIVKIPKPTFRISHQDKILSIGSCFAQNMATRFTERKFQVCSNPFGISYHPLSIVKAMNKIMDKELYQKSDLFFHNERWHSFDHHSLFSFADSDEMLKNINANITQAHQHLLSTQVIIITLGTAFIYFKKSDNVPVANCHKVPNNQFEKRLLSKDDIVASLDDLMKNINTFKEDVQFIFTVSPVRHIKDGIIENQKSKATLLLAIHEIVEKHWNAFYFPSYEIALDELRDYRFYAQDMVHLNETAIEYIWNKFSDTFFDKNTQQLNRQFKKLHLAAQHRPFNPNSNQHQQFLKKQLILVKQYQQRFPYLDFKKEEERYFKVNE